MADQENPQPDASAPPAEQVYPQLPVEETKPEEQPPQPQPVAAPPQPVPQQQPPPQQTTVVVQQQPAVTQNIVFRDVPVTFTDSSGQQVTTRLEYKNGALVWLICLAICFFTGCICIAFIPFCINGAKDVYHINPNDGSTVGVYKRI